MKGMEKKMLTSDITSSLWTLYQESTKPLWQALAFRGLTVADRRKLGGYLFPGKEQFVDNVAFGLDYDPAVFAHIPFTGAELKEEQGAALDLLFISRGLLFLSQLFYDVYLQQYSVVVQKARRVLQQVRADGQQVFTTPAQQRAQRRRELLMRAAQEVLIEMRVGFWRGGAASKGKKRRAAG